MSIKKKEEQLEQGLLHGQDRSSISADDTILNCSEYVRSLMNCTTVTTRLIAQMRTYGTYTNDPPNGWINEVCLQQFTPEVISSLRQLVSTLTELVRTLGLRRIDRLSSGLTGLWQESQSELAMLNNWLLHSEWLLTVCSKSQSSIV